MDARVQVYSDKMQKAFEFLEADFAAIRAGRANPHVLDKLRERLPLFSRWVM